MRSRLLLSFHVALVVGALVVGACGSDPIAEGTGDAAPASGDSSAADSAAADSAAADSAAADSAAADGAVADSAAADGAEADAAATDDAAAPDAAGDASTEDATAASDSADAAPDADGAVADVTPACSSALDCPAVTNPCGIAVCDPALGCLVVASPDGTLCNPGNSCSISAVCKGGACLTTNAVDCDDGNPCTDDGCAPAAGCTHVALSAKVTCDDGNACTVGDACEQGSCASGVSTCACQKTSDCAAFEDGDLCNGALYCDVTTGTCKVNPATVVVCNVAADTACSTNLCDPKVGACKLTAKPLATPCDDGKKCTTGDHCKEGACVAGTQTCCAGDADCVDDGDKCNGTSFCNLATGTCQLNPLTVVTCPTGSDTTCGQTSCQPKTGACELIPAPNGKPCDDGDPCTSADACQGGACEPGKDLCQCKADADCATVDDGDLCNGTLYCDKVVGKCKVNPATAVSCPTVNDTACTSAACQPKTGSCKVVPRADGTACDADGAACTPQDTCQAGVCTADTNVCPCQSDADCAAKEDGNLCNGTLYCDKTTNACKVNPKTVVFCADPIGPHAPCLANLCNPKSGLCITLPAHEGAGCDADGNPCTAKDTCLKGTCKADANICECQADADCAAKEDNNACNGTLYCDKVLNKCVANPATVVTCSAVFDTACQANRCQPKSGACKLEAVRELLACDADGNACTLYDVCQQGQCSPGANVCGCGIDSDCGKFDDDNLCNGKLLCGASGNLKECKVNPATVVTCKPGDPAACVTQVCDPTKGSCGPTAWPDGKPCEDSEPCTSASACAAGTCQGTTATACDDGNPCTDDACKPGSGCVALPNAATCIDGNPCTAGDACAKGVCVGKGVGCDDGNPCTQDACDVKQGGCIHVAQAGPCDDADLCTVSDACSGGACKGKAATCDDGNPCTKDVCDAKLGCQHSAVTAPCSDGNPCTSDDGCVSGVCQGKAATCDDSDVCTSDGCDSSKGACIHQAKSCDDGNPCTVDGCHKALGCLPVYATSTCNDGDPCTTGDVCQSGKCVTKGALPCDDGDPCTTDACIKGKGCSATPGGTAPCDDGVACTSKDTCDKGVCKGTIACDDGNSCTDDACDPKTGKCAGTPKPGPCDDSNICTKGDSCQDGACKPASVNLCDDGNVCTIDACDSKVGCYTKPNTLPCNLGACTLGDVCAAGTCTPGKVDRVWRRTHDLRPYRWEMGYSLLALDDGDVLIGTHADGAAGIGRLASDGSSPKWYSAIPDTSNGWVENMLKVSDGSYRALLRSNACMAVASFQTDGKVAPLVRIVHGNCNAAGTANGVQNPMAIVERKALSAPQVVVVGAREEYGAGEVVMAFDLAGNKVGEFANYTKDIYRHARDAVVDGQQRLVVLGATNEHAPWPAPSNIDATVTVLDANLQVVSRTRYGDVGNDNPLRLAKFPDGGYIIGGSSEVATKGLQDEWIARIGGDGKLLWQARRGTVHDDVLRGLLVRADGSVVVSGYSRELVGYARTESVVRAYSAAGAELWSAAVAQKDTDDDLMKIIALPGGDLLTLGQQDGSASAKTLVIRLDRHGFASCAASGKCAPYSQKGCDDGQVCTADHCDSATGCKATQHTGVCSDGDACTDIDLCTMEKTCLAGAKIDCDDGNPCTTETCLFVKGCAYQTVADGATCAAGKTCQAGVCK